MTDRRRVTAFRRGGARTLALLLALALAPAAPVAAAPKSSAQPEGALATLLLADFDAHPVGDPIGTGGAALGEPVAIDPGVSAIVEQPVGMNRVLAMEADALPQTGGVAFELLDGLEVEQGLAAFRVTLLMPALCGVNIYLREQGGAAQAFTTLGLASDGSIVVSDEAGPAGQIGTFSAGQILRLSIEHDLDAGTYDVLLNDAVLLDDRAHGVVGDGIGRFMIKFEFAQPPTRVLIDNVGVFATVPPDRLLRDGFELGT